MTDAQPKIGAIAPDPATAEIICLQDAARAKVRAITGIDNEALGTRDQRMPLRPIETRRIRLTSWLPWIRWKQHKCDHEWHVWQMTTRLGTVMLTLERCEKCGAELT